VVLANAPATPHRRHLLAAACDRLPSWLGGERPPPFELFGPGDMRTYVVRGDTLMWQTAERERLTGQTEAITGVKLVGQVETFYVRVR
jgi:hypothetical protein